MMKNILRRYSFFMIMILITAIITFFNFEIGNKAIRTSIGSFKQMALIIPPIFILLGLLDVWVPREVMMKYMGEDSGVKGIILAFVIGSAAAGPLYGAFPIAAVFMKKGVKFSNLLIFIGAWSTTKIPMFLFEMSSLGAKFAITRLLIDIPGIIIIAYLLQIIIPKEKVEEVYKNSLDI
ncbi:permease [Clostridium sediminicola]|uniref:permease n=1 Tax=Clostridium sediminicola TaxID=3114879 RepID=UPI0031F20F90